MEPQLFSQRKPFCVTLSQKWGGLLDILRPNKGKELTHMAAINMNKEQLQQMMREDKPVLVDFWAPWCGYCRRIGPAYEKIAEEYGDRLVLHGGINAVLWDQPEAIIAEIDRLVPMLKENGGYIFSSDHSIPHAVSLDNFRLIVNEVKRVGTYA